MVVRTALPEEFVAVADLRVATYIHHDYLGPADPYVEKLRRLGTDPDSPDVVLVAVDGERLVGTATLKWRGPDSELPTGPHEVEMRALAVAPEVQRRGVARRLVRAVAEEAHARGARTLLLSTHPMMWKAQRLYEAMGFHRCPERDWGPEDGSYVLKVYALPLPAQLPRAEQDRVPGSPASMC